MQYDLRSPSKTERNYQKSKEQEKKRTFIGKKDTVQILKGIDQRKFAQG